MSLILAACSGDRLPAEYRRLPVPEERLVSSEAVERGRELFGDHCALCHGINADGRGVRQLASTPPQDFTQPGWQRQATPRGLYHVIREGRRGTAMAPWKASLDEGESWDLVAYLLSLGAADTRPETAR